MSDDSKPSLDQPKASTANPVQPMGSSYNTANSNVPTIGNQEVPPSDSVRILPRQISSGLSKGEQSALGTISTIDPTTYNPSIQLSGVDQTLVLNDTDTARPIMTTSGITGNTIYSDPSTNTNRVILGKLPDGTYGLQVSQSGVDVTTASKDELIFNSNQNIFKIVKKLTINLEFTNSGGATGVLVETIEPHNLMYTPAFTAYINIDYATGSPVTTNTNYPNPAVLPLLISVANGLQIAIVATVTVDSNNVYFDIEYAPSKVNVGGPYFNSATVYLLQETFS